MKLWGRAPRLTDDEIAERFLAKALRDDRKIGIDTGQHRDPCAYCQHRRIDHVDLAGVWFDGLCRVPGCDACAETGYVAEGPL